MTSAEQHQLEQITTKHLVDNRSDELYQPFRDVNYEVQRKKYQTNSQQCSKIYQFSQTSYLPSQLKGIEITNKKMTPKKGFKKVAQRQMQYQPIPQGVMRILQEEYHGPQQIVYRYSTPKSNNETKYQYKTVSDLKTPQNKANFKQNLQKRINKIDQIQQKKPGYNLYSFLDEPFSFISVIIERKHRQRVFYKQIVLEVKSAKYFIFVHLKFSFIFVDVLMILLDLQIFQQRNLKTEMSKKFKVGQIIGIFVGVTIGAILTNYLVNSLFGKSKEQQYYQETNQGYPSQYNQPAPQVGVFEQALSAPSNAQNKVY